MTTTQEKFEADKAAVLASEEPDAKLVVSMLLDLSNRFVTAVEEIAAALTVMSQPPKSNKE